MEAEKTGRFTPRYPVLFTAMSAVIVTLLVLLVLVFLYAKDTKDESNQLREASCQLASWIESVPPRKDVPDQEEYVMNRQQLIATLRELAHCES